MIWHVISVCSFHRHFISQCEKWHSLPDSLYAVGEPLNDSCDVDRVDVPLLQLVKQHIYMIQHPLKTPSLSHSCFIKFTILSAGPKTLQEVVLVLKNGVNSTTVKVPPCWWSSRKSVCHHFIKHSGSLGWPGEKRSKTTQIWSKKHRPWWCGMLPAALSGWADEHNCVHSGHSRTRL